MVYESVALGLISLILLFVGGGFLYGLYLRATGSGGEWVDPASAEDLEDQTHE